MIKISSKILSVISLLLIINSCIQKEAPNSEADILSIIIPDGIAKIEPIIQNQSVMIIVNNGVNLSTLAPDFIITPGASIEPPGKTIRDFSIPQTYTVTSEDGKWKKNYVVSFVDAEMNTKYCFEDTLKRNNKYYIFVEKNSENNVIMEWGSGNSGFAITGVATQPTDYPTMQSNDGRTGKCLKLVTRSTGSFGASAGMPIAAGNLFIGTFDVFNALSSPLKATKFGMPFNYLPTYIIGYYKYKAGDVYFENGEEVKNKRDKFNIYAMFFETDANVNYLDGTNQDDSPNIVASAKINNPEEASDWTRFEIPFNYSDNKIIDYNKLSSGQYKLAIIFTSSINGDIFCGAPGSTLMIDDVEILYSHNK
jgi:hypothetical protein